jgi:hypothetical protein
MITSILSPDVAVHALAITAVGASLAAILKFWCALRCKADARPQPCCVCAGCYAADLENAADHCIRPRVQFPHGQSTAFDFYSGAMGELP